MADLLRIGTRASRLAMAQAGAVRAALERAHPGLAVELCPIQTTGDRRLDKPLPEIGGKGVFTLEIEEALRAGRVEIAVHSLKDLPVRLPPGLALGAIPRRESPMDVLVHRKGTSLRLLPPGSVLGTSSPRRALSIRVSYPHLRFVDLRGNVETRLRKLDAGEVDGLVMAHAGLLRLGLAGAREVEPIPLLTLVPAPGQGALALEVRADDAATLARLRPLHDADTALETTVERELLEALGGGCSMALGALARIAGGRLRLVAALAAADGRRLWRVTREVPVSRALDLPADAADEFRRLGAAEATVPGRA